DKDKEGAEVDEEKKKKKKKDKTKKDKKDGEVDEDDDRKILQLAIQALKDYQNAGPEDVQERACEALTLLGQVTDNKEIKEEKEKKKKKDKDKELKDEDVNNMDPLSLSILAKMPPFQQRQSILLRDLKKKVLKSNQGGGVEHTSRHLKGVDDKYGKDDGEDVEEVQEGGLNKQAESVFGAVAIGDKIAPNVTSPMPTQPDDIQSPSLVAQQAKLNPQQQQQQQQSAQGQDQEDDGTDTLIDIAGLGIDTGGISQTQQPIQQQQQIPQQVPPTSQLPSTIPQQVQQVPAASGTTVPPVQLMQSVTTPIQNPPLFNALVAGKEGTLFEDANIKFSC
ncbi:MAG: hypothetical protein EZS28_040353, partial [Streblomastix strix]